MQPTLEATRDGTRRVSGLIRNPGGKSPRTAPRRRGLQAASEELRCPRLQPRGHHAHAARHHDNLARRRFVSSGETQWPVESRATRIGEVSCHWRMTCHSAHRLPPVLASLRSVNAAAVVRHTTRPVPASRESRRCAARLPPLAIHDAGLQMRFKPACRSTYSRTDDSVRNSAWKGTVNA